MADKELAGREGAGRRRRSAHLRGQWETETGDRTSGLINSNRSEVMIAAQKETIGLAKGGQPYQAKSTGFGKELVAPTLADSGIDKKLSARAQKLAAMSHWGTALGNNTYGCRTA